MSRIKVQLAETIGRIDTACQRAGRENDAARLLAVSKTFPAEDIREAVCAGQRIFGESRLQEAELKLRELPGDLEWHFIGRIQRNKVRKILPLFEYVHAVDSFRLAEYMDRVAGDLGLRPKVFLQVDQAGEETKGGFSVTGLQSDFSKLMELGHLDVVGLMTIPPAVEDAEESRHWFRGLRELRDSLAAGFSAKLPFLSMGMSGDFEVAVEEGATHVRVGSAIFGKRDYRVEGELG
ncbi:MAG: YggS family pyridoxal phosphate-dependent enzyme [Akkermansiaceae bacterium]|nr:YggS family pyridoxal phosphate-dependent enzyme [Akkermansiaceae bacterium]